MMSSLLALTRRDVVQAFAAAPGLKQWLRSTNPDGEPALEPTLWRVTVPIPGLDRRIDGMRIGQISDAHIGAFLGVDHVARAVALFERNPPELLAVTGDLVDDTELIVPCLEAMSRIPAPYGRFVIMGNHENYAGREESLTGIRSHAAFTALVNEHVLVDVQGARVHVCGLDYPADRAVGRIKLGATALPPVFFVSQSHDRRAEVHKAIERAGDGDFRLGLAHHPHNFDLLHPHGIELTLSGHTHGGQVAPFGTGISRAIYKYSHGLYRQGASHVYVNGGTGHWWPWRVGVPAEVTEITLRRV